MSLKEGIRYGKPEVLAPAGDMERLVAAIRFGADAVYLAGQEFGMRASQTNFDLETLKEAVKYAHSRNVRIYVTVNTVPHNDEIDMLPPYLRHLSEIGADALIVSDIGVLSLIREHIPQMEIHISTQAGVVNYQTCNALYKMGARRVVLARELSLEEIRQIRERVPDDLEIETFVHGAMCMSFSGRCVISNYMTGRDANRGECAQPCRWGYHLMEEKRPGEYFPVYEDEKGSYILNAKDLCLLPFVDKLAAAGISSFKIEGRAKSSYYVSVVTNAYRTAVDMLMQEGDGFVLPEWLAKEVTKVSHRQYSTGFYFDTPDQYYKTGGYIREYDIVAIVERIEGDRIFCLQKNKFSEGDILEVLSPGGNPAASITAQALKSEAGEDITTAPHAGMRVSLRCDEKVSVGAILRKQL